MTAKQKRTAFRILTGAVFYVAALALSGFRIFPEEYHRLLSTAVFLVPYFIIGGDVLMRAVRNIAKGRVFDENFLMCIATVGAFVIGENLEAVAVMLFYQVGELFQSYAVTRSRKSISELMDIRPDYANVEEDGILVKKDPEEIAVGDVITVKAGERIPLDGVVVSGSAFIDTKALTGEPVPREAREGAAVVSGCINTNGLLKIRVTKVFGESTVARILDLVENAGNKKAKAENFITKFARYYTPIVVCSAALLAVLPPLLFSLSWADWVSRALIFLVISCPCALVISIPLSFFGGIGGASKIGVLVKGSNYLEVLSRVDTVVFDKTGTLTKGNFKVIKMEPAEVGEEELLETAALAECYSDHPISLSLKEAYHKTPDPGRVFGAEEISGHGVKAVVDGAAVLAGNGKLMKREGVSFRESEETGTVVYVAKEKRFIGSIVIADEIKEDAGEAIRRLKEAGVGRTVMLTGDKKETGEAVAARLDLDGVYTELLPADKVEKVEKLLEEEAPGRYLAFVGDGINDAPVLSRADLGIAMGGMGSDAAIEAADVVLMDDGPSKIADAVFIARKTMRIVKQNIIFALAVKLFFLFLGAFGAATMWEAVFADVGVSVIAILNAMRALMTKENGGEKSNKSELERNNAPFRI